MREASLMSEPTREEFVARIEASEARMETRMATMDGKLDRILDRVEVAVDAAEKAETRAEESLRASSSIKWNILFTAIGAVAVMVAAFALWAQGVEMMGTLLSAKDQLGGQ